MAFMKKRIRKTVRRALTLRRNTKTEAKVEDCEVLKRPSGKDPNQRPKTGMQCKVFDGLFREHELLKTTDFFESFEHFQASHLNKLEFLNDKMLEVYKMAFFYKFYKIKMAKKKYCGKINLNIFNNALNEVRIEPPETKSEVQSNTFRFYSPMVEDENKLRRMIEELLMENMRLKEENTELKNQLEGLADVSYSKVESSSTSDLQISYDRLTRQLNEYKKISSIFFGYQLNVDADYIQLISVYSYDESDSFVFKRSEGSVSLLNNDFANSFQTEIQQYMENGKSIPAFLSAITLYLFNQKTFG